MSEAPPATFAAGPAGDDSSVRPASAVKAEASRESETTETPVGDGRSGPADAQDDGNAERNPLREGLSLAARVQPFTLVLFGGSGDLARRKIAPALYNLMLDELLPAAVEVIGVARRPLGDDGFARHLRDGVAEFSRRKPLAKDVWNRVRCRYIGGNFRDPATYRTLAGQLDGAANVLYYLAAPPSLYAGIATALAAAGLGGDRRGGWTRIVVEKPFGHDLGTARALNDELRSVFSEDQIFRIDHYLGKETVQNILVFRFANGIWEPLWDRRYVEEVQITVAENIGIEGRGYYYEETGALRDMVQNHLLQLLCLVAMEPPVDFAPQAVRDEKVKVLHAARFDGSVRGQYSGGWVAGRQLPAYREERGVAAVSRVETYVALRLWVDNWRWAGVPFYLRTGKALPRRVSEVAVRFRPAPHTPFRQTPTPAPQPNLLTLRIQPDEGIGLRIGAKVPGPEIRIRSVDMDFRFGSAFGEGEPDAYERLLVDCLRGDSTLFTRRDEVEAAWRLMEGMLADPGTPDVYPAGSWGPERAQTLCDWRRP